MGSWRSAVSPAAAPWLLRHVHVQPNEYEVGYSEYNNGFIYRGGVQGSLELARVHTDTDRHKRDHD